MIDFYAVCMAYRQNISTNTSILHQLTNQIEARIKRRQGLTCNTGWPASGRATG